MHIIMGIDPGTDQSAFVLLVDRKIEGYGIVDNALMPAEIKKIGCRYGDDLRVAIEFIQNYGGPVGRDVFETCAWAGEYRQVCKEFGFGWYFYARPQIKAAIAGTSKGNDSLVRQALIRRYGGTKKGEPLYAIKTHMWAALAVATYCLDGAVLGAW